MRMPTCHSAEPMPVAFAIAGRLGATRIATLDRAHFSVVRPRHRDARRIHSHVAVRRIAVRVTALRSASVPGGCSAMPSVRADHPCDLPSCQSAGRTADPRSPPHWPKSTTSLALVLECGAVHPVEWMILLPVKSVPLRCGHVASRVGRRPVGFVYRPTRTHIGGSHA